MKWNCPFCQTPLTFEDKSATTCNRTCYKCPVKVILWLYKTDIDYDRIYLEINRGNKHYEIILNLKPKHTYLTLNERTTILELNYLADITPSNANDWLDRILNLKAFL